MSTGNDYADNFEQHDSKEQLYKSNNPQNLAPHNLNSTSKVDMNKGNTHLNENFTSNVDISAQKLEEYLKSELNRKTGNRRTLEFLIDLKLKKVSYLLILT